MQQDAEIVQYYVMMAVKEHTFLKLIFRIESLEPILCYNLFSKS
jgi:hypothetical protein